METLARLATSSSRTLTPIQSKFTANRYSVFSNSDNNMKTIGMVITGWQEAFSECLHCRGRCSRRRGKAGVEFARALECFGRLHAAAEPPERPTQIVMRGCKLGPRGDDALKFRHRAI